MYIIHVYLHQTQDNLTDFSLNNATVGPTKSGYFIIAHKLNKITNLKFTSYVFILPMLKERCPQQSTYFILWGYCRKK